MQSPQQLTATGGRGAGTAKLHGASALLARLARITELSVQASTVVPPRNKSAAAIAIELAREGKKPGSSRTPSAAGDAPAGTAATLVASGPPPASAARGGDTAGEPSFVPRRKARGFGAVGPQFTQQLGLFREFGKREFEARQAAARQPKPMAHKGGQQAANGVSVVNACSRCGAAQSM